MQRSASATSIATLSSCTREALVSMDTKICPPATQGADEHVYMQQGDLKLLVDIDPPDAGCRGGVTHLGVRHGVIGPRP